MTARAVSTLALLAAASLLAAVAESSAALAPDTLTFRGQRHVSLGRATLAVVDDALVVGNIGTSGTDGVRVGLVWRAVAFEADLAGFGAAAETPPDGAFLELSGVGVFGPSAPRAIGSLRATASGPLFDVTADFSPIGALTHTAELYSGTDLVVRVEGLGNPIARLPEWPTAAAVRIVSTAVPWPEEGLVPSCEVETQAEMSLSKVASVIIVEKRPGGSERPYFGDRLRILPERPAGEPAFLTAVALRARDLLSFEVPNETVAPSHVVPIREGGGLAARLPIRIDASPNPVSGGSLRIVPVGPSGASRVDLRVFDAAGREVRRLHAGPAAALDGGIAWDARDAGGRRVSAGVYFLRLETEMGRAVRRVTVLQ